MLGIVENAANGVRCVDDFTETFGVRVDRRPTSFELSCDLPGGAPVYYRVGYGSLEWGTDLTEFAPNAAGRASHSHEAGDPAPRIEPGGLLALICGTTPPPDATWMPGVRRLSVGTRVRLADDGVTTSRYSPALPGRRRSLDHAVEQFLDRLPDDYTIAYSGGVSSAFLAVCAAAAGQRPRLLHADLGQFVSSRIPAADIPGLKRTDVRVDLSELLDHHRITGAEPSPPLPDTELPRRIVERLAESSGSTMIVSAAMLKELASAKLAETGAGVKGWRLLTGEPFHLSGSFRSLREAREFVYAGKLSRPGAKPENAEQDAINEVLPGLTESGREAMYSFRKSAMALWKQHLDELPSVLGRLDAGIQERGLYGHEALPATDPVLLATVSALRPSRLGGMRKGTFHNHLLLRRTLAAHKAPEIPVTSPGFRTRLAAAVHLHRERDKVIAQLVRECALADHGMIEPGPIIEVLRNGRALADHALAVLRLVWVDQWLRGR